MARILTLTLNPSVDVSATAPAVVPVRKTRCEAATREPGGGGINVARVLRRLGGDVHALHTAGGPTGQLLRRLLDAEAVPATTIPVAADTRESFTVLDRTLGEQYRFVLPGASLTDEDCARCLEHAEGLLDGTDFLVISGSMPPGFHEFATADLCGLAARAGARVIIDSSGAGLAAALEAGVCLAKPNLRELRELTDAPLERQAEWERAARDLVSSGGAEAVALTLGDQGAFLATASRCWRAAPISVDIVSAVGAGDSFLAAMILALAENQPIELAFRHGVAAGTAALLTPGTELCREHDVMRLLADVTLVPVPV